MKIILSIFILLGVIICVHSETCPAKEDIFPCSCEQLVVGKSRLTVKCMNVDSRGWVKTVLKKLSGKDNVDFRLSGSHLGTLPSNFFYGVGIKKLEMARCQLDSLTNDTQPGLLGLENSLEDLTIDSSFTGKHVPPKLQVGHLKKLKNLDLSFNTIDELGDDWFQNAPPSLESLLISYNNIKKIGREAFVNLNNLTFLALQNNQFGSIRREIFPKPALKLRFLGLDKNGITRLPVDIFNDMPSLSYVSLRGNKFTSLDYIVWRAVWDNLDAIRLEGTPIRCDSSLYWVFRHKIKENLIYGNCYNSDGTPGETIQEFIDSASMNKLS